GQDCNRTGYCPASVSNYRPIIARLAVLRVCKGVTRARRARDIHSIVDPLITQRTRTVYLKSKCRCCPLVDALILRLRQNAWRSRAKTEGPIRTRGRNGSISQHYSRKNTEA